MTYDVLLLLAYHIYKSYNLTPPPFPKAPACCAAWLAAARRSLLSETTEASWGWNKNDPQW